MPHTAPPTAQFSFQQVRSTNDTAKRLSTRITNQNFVVTAARQLAGRGQFDRQWESTPGGLYYSYVAQIHRPVHTPNFAATICQLIAPLVVRSIAIVAEITPEIEWPNDILLEDRKLGGILVESLSRGELIQAIVIGIGININQLGFAPTLQQVAISLRQHSGQRFEIEAFATQLTKEIDYVVTRDPWRNCFR